MEKFWPGKGNCFDWPSCYSSFESAGPFFFHWGLYLIVAGILIRNTLSPEAAESFLTTEHSLCLSCKAGTFKIERFKKING